MAGVDEPGLRAYRTRSIMSPKQRHSNRTEPSAAKKTDAAAVEPLVPPQDSPTPELVAGEENARLDEESQPIEIPIEMAPEKPSVPPEEEPLQARLLRLQADFENFRKRMDREKKDWIAFANERLIVELLPVMDHFELGLEDSAKNGAPQAMVAGFQLVYNQMRAALEKTGVAIISAEGAAFDPHLHEATTTLPSESVPEGHIIAQIRRGYKLGDKLLRAAQVVVSSGPSA